MIAATFVVVALLTGSQGGPDEASLRAAVQRFYDAQAAKDLRATVASWSPAAPERPTDDTYQAIFDTGEDRFTVEIRDLVIVGPGARLSVFVRRVRTAHENGQDKVYRGEALNNQEWRYEDGAWKLVRDREAAEDFADRLFSAGPERWTALLAAEPDQVTKALRHAIAMRASGWGARQQYQQALTGFQLSLAVDRLLHDRNGEIESLQNVANAYYFLRDYARAGEFYGTALVAATEADVPEQVALAQLGLGTVAYSRGDYAAALAAYEAAKAIYEARAEGASTGRALISIGNVQFVAGEYDTAAASYRRALDLLVAGEDFGGAWLARSGLGRVFATQGDLTPALREYHELLADARARPSPGQLAMTLESIGEINYRTGDTDAARGAFKRSTMLYDALVNDQASAARVLGDLGLTELSAGRRDEALAAYTESRDRYNKAGRPDGVAHAWVGIGFSLAAARKFDEAIAAYQTAITMLDEQQRAEDSARAWLGLSMAQEGSGAYDTALASARHVRAAADALNSDELRWRGAAREGAALRKLGRFDEAVASLEAAAVVIDRMSADAGTSAEARTALDDSPSAWAELAFALAQKHDADGALLAAERRHAQIRRLMLAGFERDVATGMTPDEQRDEQQLGRDIVSARAQLRAERAAARPDAARLSRLQEQLAGLLTRRAAQQAALYARLPDLQAWRAVRLPAELPATALPDGTVLVEYIVGDDDLFIAWRGTGPEGPSSGAVVVPKPARDIAEVVAKALEPAALKDAKEWRTRSAPLSDILLKPVRAALDGHEACVIVPDDFLWRVPFEALPLDERDLAWRMQVGYSASLVSLARHVAMGKSFAVPVAVVSPVLAPAFPDTEPAVRAAVGSAALTVVGAPLDMTGAAPLFSSILLAPGAESADGRLEVRDWFDIESAHGVVVAPDAHAYERKGVGLALEGLDWATAAAGVPAIIIGRGPDGVFRNDVLLRAVYAHLARGERPGDAWRAAIADARATAGAAPAAWAGLRLLGSPR